MGGYHLSLQATYPARPDGSRKNTRKASRFFEKKAQKSKKCEASDGPNVAPIRIASSLQTSNRIAPAIFQPSPPRHSTACCDGLSETQRREMEKWFHLPRPRAGAIPDFASLGHSFRSEDSESLALWEEKEQSGQTVSGDLSWLRLGKDSPWRGSMSHAVKKFEALSHVMVGSKEKLMPWRNSPVHPKASAVESPRLSLDRHTGTKSSWRSSFTSKTNGAISHDSSRAWYSTSIRTISSGEPGSTRSPPSASKPSCFNVNDERDWNSTAASKRADMELCVDNKKPEESSSEREEDEQTMERKIDTKSISDENTRFTSHAVAWDIALMPEPVEEKPRLATGIAWEIPMDVPTTLPEQTEEKESKQSCGTAENDNVRRLSSAIAWETLQTSPHDDMPMRSPGAIPFEWEDRPGMPKMERSVSPKKSHSLDENMFSQLSIEEDVQQAQTASTSPLQGERKVCRSSYNRTDERSSRMGSSDGVKHGGIDLVSPSAAKFLDPEGCPSPVLAPIKSEGAVPFKWEEAPGKPKAGEASSSQIDSALQLPPRLITQKQGPLSQQLRNHYINKSMSAPLAEFYTLPPKISSPSSTQHQYVSSNPSNVTPSLPPWVRASSRMAANDSDAVSKSVRDSSMVAAKIKTLESLLMKSKPVMETSSKLRTLSSQEDSMFEVAMKPCNTEDLSVHSILQKRSLKGDFNPDSPTSILCGPDDGSLPSSTPSLSSEPELSTISATPTSTSLSHSNFSVSFDSTEHHSEMASPVYNLTPPSDASKDVRRISLSFRDFGPSREEYGGKHAEGGAAATESSEAIRLQKNESQWLKIKSPLKGGTVPSPDTWAPLSSLNYQCDEPSPSRQSDKLDTPDAASALESDKNVKSPTGRDRTSVPNVMPLVEVQGSQTPEEPIEAPNSDFSARLGGRSSPLKLNSESNCIMSRKSRIEVTDTCFVPVDSNPQDVEVGNRSPDYRTSLELLAPIEKSSLKKRNKKLKLKRRVSTGRRPSARVRVRARFIVSISKALKKFFSRCSLTRFTSKVTVADKKLLYQAEYTLAPSDFRFSKPN